MFETISKIYGFFPLGKKRSTRLLELTSDIYAEPIQLNKLGDGFYVLVHVINKVF